nr:hypothetical protein [Tanacetum cinerariifolium]
MARCKMAFREDSDTRNIKFTQEHAWLILKIRPSRDSLKAVNPDDQTRHPELFSGDPRERPPGNLRKAKKTKSDTTSSSGVVTRKIWGMFSNPSLDANVKPP